MPVDPSGDSAGQEVEVKYQVDDADRLVRTLATHGVVLSAPVHQDDQAYAPVGWAYGQPKAGVPFARLRTQDGKHLFTVKKPLDNEMACMECESEVADRGQMHAALLAMGFYPTVRIVKVRRTGSLGALSLCLDQVEHAGAFLEVEQHVGLDQSGHDTQARLNKFVRSLGVPAQRVTETYDSLIRAALLARAR
ncbi:class IV adenylate cyclase [Micromonospora sp. CPCC 206061]|uniref:class IV adenylate cyclase n=1 Tax=Micromonospora sp. CPCC 206061 TaxID=3122410 RepID=UPI002FF394E8